MSNWAERRVAVTGGAGFIGGHFLTRVAPKHPEATFINLDALTYAASLDRLEAISAAPNYRFEQLDIRDRDAVQACFEKHEITDVVHFAAESHVDRSLYNPLIFVETNVLGTVNLLEAAFRRTEQMGKAPSDFRFLHVSTDETYGSLELDCGQSFTEESRYAPSSPYAASKASSDHFVRAWGRTYGLNVVVTNCSNNYGPYQFPEKLIPLMISNAVDGKPLPIYGDGRNVRDWIFVEDHCEALETVFERGGMGETYNVGASNEMANIDIVKLLCDIVDSKAQPLPDDRPRRDLIHFVTDRPGHDRRYAVDSSKLQSELGWAPSHSFADGIGISVDWYLNHQEWLIERKSGTSFQQHYTRHYTARED